MIGQEILRFKDDRSKEEWEKVGTFLKKLVLDLALRRWEMLHLASTVTSVYRTPEENRAVGGRSKTHCEWRAVDVRASGDPVKEELVRQQMNKTWETGVAGMPRIPPLDHGTGPHHHVQVTRSEMKRYSETTEVK